MVCRSAGRSMSHDGDSLGERRGVQDLSAHHRDRYAVLSGDIRALERIAHNADAVLVDAEPRERSCFGEGKD